MHRKPVWLLLFVTLVSSAARSQTTPDNEMNKGLAAAEAWLQLIDEGKYNESWEAASELFRQNMRKVGKGKSFWEKVLRTTRVPLGPLKKRRLLTQELTDTVATAPPGEYLVLRYRTSFENKLVTEQLTLILEKESRWRIFSYVARPADRTQP
jgi:hypothetical protein